MSAELHELTITKLDDDGDVAEFRITHCPKDDRCAVWHECKEKECDSLRAAAFDGDDDELEITRHGLLHKVFDYALFTRDDPHNCGVQYSGDWDFTAGLTVGSVCTFDVDYEDGEWYPVDIELKEVPSK